MKYAFLAVTLLISIQCEAKNTILATFGYATGGETIIKKDPTLFDADSNRSLKAGQGFIGEFGVDLGITDNIAVRLLIGQKIGFATSSNAEHEIKTNPSSALFLITVDRVTIGAGVTYHIRPAYSAEGSNSSVYDDSTNFDDAIGFSGLISVSLTRKGFFSLGLRYTAISYEGGQAPKNFSTGYAIRTKSSYNANNLALVGVFKF